MDREDICLLREAVPDDRRVPSGKFFQILRIDAANDTLTCNDHFPVIIALGLKRV